MEPTKDTTNKPNDLTDEQLEIVTKIVTKNRQLNVAAEFQPPVDVGHRVSMYRFLPKGTTRVADMQRVNEDLALALGIKNEKILIQRIPGEPFVGIYIPNKDAKHMSLTDSLTSTWKEMNERKLKVPLCFGTDWKGHPFVEDLTDLPHLLIAGSTGGGKSVLFRALLTNIVCNKQPDEVQLVLSDTKQVELNEFTDLPHLRHKIAKSPQETLMQLDDVIEEAGKRLVTLADAHVKNLHEYNELADASVQGSNNHYKKKPYIVCFIDELFDVLSMKTERGEPKASDRLAVIVSRARAAGVYMIAATQRPSVDVVKGVIKANFPARLSFRLTSYADSKTILEADGAQYLLTKGDMLYSSPLRSELVRLHAPYATADEIRAAITYAMFYKEKKLV